VRVYEFANQASGVKYVGNAACVKCHPEITTDYARSVKGRAWSEVAATNGVEDFDSTAVVEDSTRGFKYRVFRRGQKAFVEEFRTNDAEKTHSLIREIRYAIGSGNHGRSYIAEHDGYLTLLPLGWYTGSKTWDLAPGYRARNQRFDRPVPAQCVFCHNAPPPHVAGSENRYRPPFGQGISCEQCHGPGELHVRTHRARAGQPRTGTPGERDRTIFNPRHVAAARQDDVCLQCHLEADVSFPTTGTAWGDFRPGLRLADYHRAFFVVPQDPTGFQFASHPPRLRLSACWQNGATRGQLTCSSCHDPHVPGSEFTAADYNERCMECHAPPDCRRPADPADTANCVGCHMPKNPPSNVAHTVFTEHWIRQRPEVKQAEPSFVRTHRADRPLELLDFWTDERPASAAERAIAHARFLDVAGGSRTAELQRAVGMLMSAATEERQNAEVRFWLGAMLELRGDFHAAARAYDEAVRLRPDHHLTHYSLGGVYLALNRPDAARAALETAQRIGPDHLGTYVKLARARAALGQIAAALEAIEQGVARFPYDPELLMQRVELLMAGSGPSDEAHQAVQRVLQLDPDRRDALWVLAQISGARGRPREAIDALRGVLRTDPKSVPTLLALGSLLQRERRIEEAREVLEQLRQLQPKHPGLATLERQLSAGGSGTDQ
jgi:tetratricopeptide (TPR) repeat protein